MTLTFTSGDYSGLANELDRARFEGSCHSGIVAMHVVMLPKMGLHLFQKLVSRLGLGFMGAARDDVIAYKLKHWQAFFRWSRQGTARQFRPV